MTKLSAFCIKDTSKILKKEFLALSPSIGLLTLSTPCLISNLRYFKPAGSSHDLAKLLFYQRSDKSGRRYGPTTLSQSRSSAIYWLSSQKLGFLVGLSLSEHTGDSRRLDSLLKQQGIECNYVDGHWTGVSLERYRRIIHLVSKTDSSLDYRMALVLRALWEKSVSKRCLLDFILGVEVGIGMKVINEDYSDLRHTNSMMQQEWLTSKFTTNDFNHQILSEAVDSLFHFEGPDVGNSLEIISAALAIERSVKMPIQLGRYSINGGPLRPDCVEVVVREIFEALLFDSEKREFNSSLLPPSVHPKIHEIFSGDNRVDSASNLGQDWFSACSSLTGCDYLSQCANGDRYELRPTMRNVCSAVGSLLGIPSCSWTSLKELQTYWCNHVGINSAIQVEEGITTFRAPFSDTETIRREVGKLRIPQNNMELSIELEDAHSLATVRHSRLSTQLLFGNESVVFRKLCQELDKEAVDSPNGLRSLYLRIVSAAVFKDYMLYTCPETPSLGRLVHSLLSCSWGEERSGDVLVDGNGFVSVSDGAMSNAAKLKNEAMEIDLGMIALRKIRQTSANSQLCSQLLEYALRDWVHPATPFQEILSELIRFEYFSLIEFEKNNPSSLFTIASKFVRLESSFHDICQLRKFVPIGSLLTLIFYRMRNQLLCLYKS